MAFVPWCYSHDFVILHGKREVIRVYNYKEVNSANNLNKLAVDSIPEPLDKGLAHQHLIQIYETLRTQQSPLHFWPPQLWGNKCCFKLLSL